MRAKEGGKETTGETALRLPSVPFPWSLAVHHQSLAFRARLCHAKNEAPEEEAGLITYLAYGAKYISRQDRFGTRETRFVDHLNGITKLSIILRSERLRLKRSVILLRQLYRGSSRKRTPSGNEKNVRNWSCPQLTRVSVSFH